MSVAFNPVRQQLHAAHVARQQRLNRKPVATPPPAAGLVKAGPVAQSADAPPLIVRDWLPIAGNGITVPLSWAILHATAAAFGVSRASLVANIYAVQMEVARATAAWLLRRHVGLSLAKIGILLGGRHYTTTMLDLRRLNFILTRDTILLGDDWKANLSALARIASLPRCVDLRPPRSASSDAGERG